MRSRPLLAWAGVFVAAGGVFLFSKTVTVLCVRNPYHGAPIYFKVTPPERVTLFFVNSIYNAPVEEVFEVRQGALVLEEVRIDSAAVMEYYGFENSGPLQILNRNLGPALSVQISMRQDQTLQIGGRTMDLRALGNPGDHVQIRVQDVSLASYLLTKMRFLTRICGLMGAQGDCQGRDTERV